MDEKLGCYNAVVHLETNCRSLLGDEELVEKERAMRNVQEEESAGAAASWQSQCN